MTLSEIKTIIQERLESQFLADFGGDLHDESDLFEEGIIDSFGLVDLVGFLETTFSIHFNDEELMSPQMATLRGMSEMIEKKQADG